MRTIRALIELGESMKLPSAADLDAVAQEQRIKRQTKKPTQCMRHARKPNEGFQRFCREGGFR